MNARKLLEGLNRQTGASFVRLIEQRLREFGIEPEAVKTFEDGIISWAFKMEPIRFAISIYMVAGSESLFLIATVELGKISNVDDAPRIMRWLAEKNMAFVGPYRLAYRPDDDSVHLVVRDECRPESIESALELLPLSFRLTEELTSI
jgi:hypothetical protein